METDPDIEDLKKTIARQHALIEETNRMVHQLRRNMWWSRIWSIVWWLLILGTSGAAYYLYVQPYVTDVLNGYAKVQSGEETAQTWEQQATQWFRQWIPGASTTTQQ